MTPERLELARWREMQRTVRRCRHLAHACRTPVARLIRFNRALSQAWTKSLTKLERLNENHGLEAIEPTQGERVEELAELTTTLEGFDRKISDKIARLQGRKPRPVKTIEQKIATRKVVRAKEQRRREAFGKAHEKWKRHVQDTAARYLGKFPPQPIIRWLEAIERNAYANNAAARSAIRHQPGWEGVADELLGLAKNEPKL